MQAPGNKHNYPDDIEDKPARDDCTGDTVHISSVHDHSREPSNFGTSSNSKFVYDPGGNDLDTKDGLIRDDSDSASSSNVSHTADTHCNFDRDRDKTIASPSDANAVPSIDLAQAIPIPDITSPRPTNNLPTILHRDSTYIDAAQHPPSLHHLADPLDSDHTQASILDTTSTPPALYSHKSNVDTANTARAHAAFTAIALITATVKVQGP